MFRKLLTTTTSRNGWYASGRIAMCSGRRYKSSTAMATAPYDQSLESFPSLIIGSHSIEPCGSFAQAQATYLEPDESAVEALKMRLQEANAGVVAHYYMDVELQGVLQAVKKDPAFATRIGIADSLKMGDLAVHMARNDQVTSVACLGVDFMSESVQAILNSNGLEIPVYRAAQAKIGCSLAESAEREVYQAWLRQESEQQTALHVVYINTSLETKAVSSSIVPTITCTSSNVLQTILQASAQVPNLKLLYGPDTYMGDNLVTLLTALLQQEDWDDAKIQRDLHPLHSRASLERLRDSIRVFPSGNCVVHHMFGQSVVDTVRKHYDDCYVTAHLEVPGEMFDIAMTKSLTDEGVVGSTSDILNFISRKVQAAAAQDDASSSRRLKFVLGTEAGMVTSIVQSVQNILQEATSNGTSIEAEIIFPVSSEAVAATDDDSNTDLALVPGVSGGEGCSTAGGCATCPFMKMNDLDALMDVLELVAGSADNNEPSKVLQKHLPPDRLRGKFLNGQPALELGTLPIRYMRDLMKEKALPAELVQLVQEQRTKGSQ